MLKPLAIAALALLATMSARAEDPADPYGYMGWGIGRRPGLLWEQVKFHGPTNNMPALTYAFGRPTYLGKTALDMCANYDRCSETLDFDTRLVGSFQITARNADTGESMIVVQDAELRDGGIGAAISGVNGELSGNRAINLGEEVTLMFATPVKLVGLTLFDENHSPAGHLLDDLDPTEHVGLRIDGGPLISLSMSNNFPFYGAQSTLIGRSFTFSYVDEDYFLGAFKVATVPEPASWVLSGLALAGLLARRRRQA